MELAGEPIPAVAWLGNSPDLAKTGVLGVKSARTQVRRALRSMGNPPEATERWIGAWSELATARGGDGPWGSPANERSRSAGLRLGPGSVCVRVQSQNKARARRCSFAGDSPRRGCSASGGGAPACSAQASGAGYGPRYLSQKEQGGGPKLTKGAGRSGSQHRGIDSEVRRRHSELLAWSD